MVLLIMMMNTVQANKCENSGTSASVQLQTTARTMHSASVFQQKVIILTIKHEKFWKKIPEFRKKGQNSKIPEY